MEQNFQREAAILVGQMDKQVRDIVRMNSGFVAGGAITSVFSYQQINDFDIFLHEDKDVTNVIAQLRNKVREKQIELESVIETDTAFSFKVKGKRYQFVKVLTGSMRNVVDNFDFTICMGAWSQQHGFLLDESFLHHLSQRRLVFNINAAYPICSLYRARKFIKRGFTMNGIEAIKLGLTIQNLDLSTYAELRKQLMGIDTLFLKDLTDSLKGQEQKEYDKKEFFEMLDTYLAKLDALTGDEE